MRFEVEDQGIGIGAEQQGVLFSTFDQADNSTTRRHGGLGLALRAALGAQAEQLGREIGRFEFAAARETLRKLRKECLKP